jgi:hypothetical protein
LAEERLAAASVDKQASNPNPSRLGDETMNWRWKFGIVVAAIAMAAGCSYCEGGQDTAQTLANKAAPCNFPSGTFPTLSNADVQACDQNFANCGPNDQTLLRGYRDCISTLPQCSTSTVDAWNASVVDCHAILGPITPACLALFSPQ